MRSTVSKTSKLLSYAGSLYKLSQHYEITSPDVTYILLIYFSETTALCGIIT